MVNGFLQRFKVFESLGKLLRECDRRDKARVSRALILT